jgi:N6-L-threonylcarbamoyladenine synthase
MPKAERVAWAIKNPEIESKEYQEGNQLGFWNTREYVLFRDNHKCHGKKDCRNKILNVHHIESRKRTEYNS